MPDVPRKILGIHATFPVSQNMPLPRGQIIVEIQDDEELLIGKGPSKVYIQMCVYLTGIWRCSVGFGVYQESPSCTGRIE